MGKWGFGLKTLRAITERGLAARDLLPGVPFDYALALDLIPRLLAAACAADKRSLDQLIVDVGEKWVREHVFAPNPQTAYLRARPGNELDFDLHRVRVTDLAELLYNLQTVTGVDAIYQRIIRDPAGLEGTILELEGLRLLWLAGLRFHIVQGCGPRGSAYECNVLLPSGETVHCEMKCKLETTAYTVSTLNSTLLTAREQLPPGGCGVVLLKMPQSWLEGSQDTVNSINDVIRRFLARTSRVAEVVWYSHPVMYSGQWGFAPLVFNEYLNPKAPSVRLLDGGLLSGGLRQNTGWVHLSGVTKDALTAFLAVALDGPPDGHGE